MPAGFYFVKAILFATLFAKFILFLIIFSTKKVGTNKFVTKKLDFQKKKNKQVFLTLFPLKKKPLCEISHRGLTIKI